MAPNTDKKIAFFIADFTGGGVERMTLSMVDYLRKTGNRAEIIVLRHQGSLSDEIPKDIPVKVLGVSNFPKAILPLGRYMRSAKLDALVSATPLANNAAILAKLISRASTRIITSDRGDPRRAHYRGGRAKQLIVPRLSRNLYPLAFANVAVSNGVADQMAETLSLNRQKITTIYNPVEFSTTGNPAKHPWLQKDRDFYTLIAAGRLSRQKDYPTLFRAMSELRNRNAPVRLVVFGEGPDLRGLESLRSELQLNEYIDMPGFQPDLQSEMMAADMFVMSSQWEGMPNAMIEAFARKIRIVSTDCPFGPSEILEKGKHGHLVPMSDPVAFADAVQKGLALPIPEGRDVSLQRFSKEEAARQYLRLITE